MKNAQIFLIERFLYHANNIPEKEFIEEKLFYNGY